MKKKLLALLLILTIPFVLASCDMGSHTGNKSSGSSANTSNNNEELNLDGIPQEWVNLFTFDNVTIFLKIM